jgi:diacylglycerol kinase
MLQNQSLRQAFINAYKGLQFVFRTQRNAKIHLLISVNIILMGVFFHITSMQWVATSLAIGLVWAAECMNTAVEKLTDLASPEYHILARIAKDCAAAAVLMASITSVVVGLIIFLPRLLIVLNLFK